MEVFLTILHYISGPLIGAAIGWLTNYLAVKMLFHPYKPWHIGKLKIPLTPGIIPKRRHHLARAIGDAVQGTLLTQEDLRSEFIDKGGIRLREWMSGITVGDMMEEKDRKVLLDALEGLIFDKLVQASYNQELNDFLEEKVHQAIKKRMGNNPLRVFINENMVHNMMKGQLTVTLTETEAVTADGTIRVNLVRQYIRNTLEQLADKDLNSLLLREEQADAPEPGDSQLQVRKAWDRTIDKVLEGAAGFMLDRLNVSKIIEEKIDAMPMEDLEKLILSVMKKELSAIVNLGALIGFVIGLVNVFI
ncbi:MAG: DUF445 family protein [Clostridia bacterium]|nr:DUF445 family protein [Clostridia bacterium]